MFHSMNTLRERIRKVGFLPGYMCIPATGNINMRRAELRIEVKCGMLKGIENPTPSFGVHCHSLRLDSDTLLLLSLIMN